MYVTELFAEDDTPNDDEENVFSPDENDRIYLDDLTTQGHFRNVIQRLARFHRVKLGFDDHKHKWFATSTEGLHPFMNDAKYITSAAGYGAIKEEHVNEIKQSTVRRAMLNALAKEVDQIKTGNMVGAVDTGKKIAFGKSQLDRKMRRNGPEQVATEASMTKSVPSKKESEFNKGVEKLIGQQVAIVVRDHPDSVAYGLFKRIGETGLCHIKLNGGKLPGWASGDMIAVRPSELYAPWDTRLQDKTAVHREYGNNGEKTVREDNKWAKLPSGDYRNMDTGRAYSQKGGGPENGGNSSYMTPEYMMAHYKKRLAQIEAGPYKYPKEVASIKRAMAKIEGHRSYMLHRDGTETPVREGAENDFIGMAKNAISAQTQASLKKADNTPFEAHGIRGMKRLPWTKKFKNVREMERFCDKYDAEVLGTRDLESAKRGNLSPAMTEGNNMKSNEFITEASALDSLGFSKEFISHTYRRFNVKHDAQPVSATTKPKASDLTKYVFLSRTKSGKAFAVGMGDKGWSGPAWAHIVVDDNGSISDKSMPATKALALVAKGTYYAIPFDSWRDRNRSQPDTEYKRRNPNEPGWQQEEPQIKAQRYLGRAEEVFGEHVRAEMNKVADFVYANLRRFTKEKPYYNGESPQEKALAVANKLEAAAKKPLNTGWMGSWDNPTYLERYLQSLNKLSHGFASVPSNYRSFVDVMDETPAGLAKFAKFILSTVHAYEEQVKNMLAEPVMNALQADHDS